MGAKVKGGALDVNSSLDSAITNKILRQMNISYILNQFNSNFIRLKQILKSI